MANFANDSDSVQQAIRCVRDPEGQAVGRWDQRPPGAGGRVVATGAAKPNTNFYVESPSVRELAEDIAGAKTVVLYQSPQQTGKTTDALAMCRLLRRHNYEVVFLALKDIVKAAMQDGARSAEPIWRMVLRELGVSTAPGLGAFETLKFDVLQHSTGPLVALVFDECDALLEVPAAFRDMMAGVRSMSQLRYPESRLVGQLLVGTQRLVRAIPDAMEGTYMSNLNVGRVLGPEPFSQQEVSSLFEQLVDARSGSLSESLEDWTSSLWSNTKGHRGLTAKCLLELDRHIFGAKVPCKLATWETLMRREGLAQQIIESMTSTYECMLKAVHASDPAMQEVIRNLLLTGRHAIMSEYPPSCAEFSLLRDGVVKMVGEFDEAFLEASSPLLAAAMLRADLESAQASLQLPRRLANPAARPKPTAAPPPPRHRASAAGAFRQPQRTRHGGRGWQARNLRTAFQGRSTRVFLWGAGGICGAMHCTHFC